MSNNTKFIIVLSLFAGAQIGYFCGRTGVTVPVVPEARAGSLVVQAGGEVVTTNEAGDKLYVWFKSEDLKRYSEIKYSCVEFVK